ncbi:MAG: hypothetical protein JW791_02720 [Nanoarchaeota archaeon]|nr:hypothetical protein [Nanoarchaeota archaeon]
MSELYSDFVQRVKLTIEYFNEDADIISSIESKAKKKVYLSVIDQLIEVTEKYCLDEDGSRLSVSELLEKSEEELVKIIKENIETEPAKSNNLIFEVIMKGLENKLASDNDLVKIREARKAISELYDDFSSYFIDGGENLLKEEVENSSAFSLIKKTKEKTELLRKVYDAFENVRKKVDNWFYVHS